MDSQKLKHLLAVVEHGTFSDAARAVHLTQPALSRSIRSLEDELKAQLFDRGARRASLTVFGELVAERARRIRLEMTQLQRDMELLRGLVYFQYPNQIGPCVYAIHSPPQGVARQCTAGVW